MNESMQQALGRDVMAADTATSVGVVKAFVVDQPPRTITAIHVSGRKRSAELVDWSQVSGFGPDAVMVASASSIRDAEVEREEEMARHNVDLLGTRVLDTAGYEHGTIIDVAFDSESGAIEHVTTDDQRTIPVDELRGLGSYAAVVQAKKESNE